jgi:hypothetical protein
MGINPRKRRREEESKNFDHGENKQVFFIYTTTDQDVPTNVTHVHIQEGVRVIKEYAFKHCERLTKVTIPSSVQSINCCAFDGCISLTAVIIPQNVTNIDNCAFYGCSSLHTMILPRNLITIGSGAFNGCSSLESITLPEKVRTIGHFAFYGCSSLDGITLPENVMQIKEHAFAGCSSLHSIIIPIPTEFFSNSFDKGTKIIRSNWFVLGEYVKMRDLVEKGRASPLKEEEQQQQQIVQGKDLEILKHLIVDECDDIFRTILEMVKEEPLPPSNKISHIY